MIILKEELLIGTGKERYCFQHPNDDNLCIKISKETRNRKYEENKKEYDYFNKYFRWNEQTLPIAKPFQWISTNLGEGLCYEKIQDYDKKTSRTLKALLANNAISQEKIITEMMLLKEEFVEKLIYPIDLNLGNIAFQRLSENQYRLVLIDGYGTTNIVPAMTISKKLGRKQIARKFDKQINKLLNKYATQAA